jgi:hypothetical protein
MNSESNPPSRAEITDEFYKWAVGGGIVTMALFPLALPLIALTAIAVLPLLLIALVPVLLVAAVALPILLVRRLWRPVVRAQRPGGTAAGRTA